MAFNVSYLRVVVVVVVVVGELHPPNSVESRDLEHVGSLPEHVGSLPRA